MTETNSAQETGLKRRATDKADAEAFDELVKPLRRQLFAYLYRMTAHRATAEDLLQETLLRAFANRSQFRREAEFKTWLFQIATNLRLDELRQKTRWRVDAQLDGEQETDADAGKLEELESVMSRPDFRFEVREHIAFCFSCIGRTLEPEEQAAILLREICGLSNEEAARAMEVSEPVLRHTLARARRRMTEIYEGMCALINKQGVCNQCQSLREFAPARNRGANLVQITVKPGVAVTADRLFDERLAIVRRANLEYGASGELHQLFFDEITEREDARGVEN